MEEPLMSPLKKKKKLEVNFPRKVLLHRRNRLARKTRELNETKVKITADEIVMTKKISQHLCNHLAQKVKQLNETANEILLTKMIPQHPRDRLIKVKELNDEFSL